MKTKRKSIVKQIGCFIAYGAAALGATLTNVNADYKWIDWWVHETHDNFVLLDDVEGEPETIDVIIEPGEDLVPPVTIINASCNGPMTWGKHYECSTSHSFNIAASLSTSAMGAVRVKLVGEASITVTAQYEGGYTYSDAVTHGETLGGSMPECRFHTVFRRADLMQAQVRVTRHTYRWQCEGPDYNTGILSNPVEDDSYGWGAKNITIGAGNPQGNVPDCDCS